MIESFVFSGLSRNRCTKYLSVLNLNRAFFISEFVFCFVVRITDVLQVLKGISESWKM